LQNLIEKFSEMKVKNEDLSSMVDIGCNFYVKAKIPSIEYLYVDIGLGFYLEMTHKEALAYIKERTELLNDRAELFRKKSFEIKARIKICLEMAWAAILTKKLKVNVFVYEEYRFKPTGRLQTNLEHNTLDCCKGTRQHRNVISAFKSCNVVQHQHTLQNAVMSFILKWCTAKKRRDNISSSVGS
uniref:Protein UXT-like protein n=1 Tax=Schistocephalus solidus TaxID=70667 RepID=A0A183TGQ6_SCHSO